MITVGLTYDLQDDYLAQGFSKEDSAEFDQRETIDAIENALIKNGYRVDRIGNVQALVLRLAYNERWDIVFNICEGVKGIAREAQVPALLEAYNIPFVFSDAQAMVVTMDKALAKRLVAEVGLATAQFAVVKTIDDIASINLPFPLFAKPIAEGTGKGISKASYLKTREDLTASCHDLLQRFDQPVLVEQYLSGRDLTVGIVGSGDRARVIGVMESFYKNDSAKFEGQSYYNKEHWKSVLSYAIAQGETAKRAADLALASWRILDCKDGGRVDLRCDANDVPHFLEINPLAGLQPDHSDLPMLAGMMDVDYDSLIGQMMYEACLRYGLVNKKNATTTKETSTKKKRIMILYSGEDAGEREDEQDTLVQLKEIIHELEALNYQTSALAFKESTGAIEAKIKQWNPDGVFNLVESVDQSDRLQYTATAMLDRLKIPYTGASTAAMAMLSSKVQTKIILQHANLATPAFYRKNCLATLTSDKNTLRYIVKSDSEHASVGLDAHSVVDGLEAARKLIDQKASEHGGDWFAEEYIEGREFNVAMIGRQGQVPRLLPPTEIIFKDYPKALAKIVDYTAKWEQESFQYQATQRKMDFRKDEEGLLNEIKEMSQKCWSLFGLSGAVRVDFRIDEQNQPWIIDINANPCLSSDAGLMAAATKDGLSMRDVIKEMIKIGLCP